MVDEGFKRKLSAILSADVKGYSTISKVENRKVVVRSRSGGYKRSVGYADRELWGIGRIWKIVHSS